MDPIVCLVRHLSYALKSLSRDQALKSADHSITCTGLLQSINCKCNHIPTKWRQGATKMVEQNSACATLK